MMNIVTNAMAGAAANVASRAIEEIATPENIVKFTTYVAKKIPKNTIVIAAGAAAVAGGIYAVKKIKDLKEENEMLKANKNMEEC